MFSRLSIYTKCTQCIVFHCGLLTIFESIFSRALISLTGCYILRNYFWQVEFKQNYNKLAILDPWPRKQLIFISYWFWLACTIPGRVGGAVGYLERSSRMHKVGFSNSSRDKPKSMKQVVIAPLPNARQQIWMSRLLVKDLYRGISCVTAMWYATEPSLLNGHEY